MKYEAFISYRHGDIDGDVAVQVQKEIERYKVPKKIAERIGKKHVGKAFRDTDELHASSDLSAVIQEALDESEWLIVICSPRYLESQWCRQEIEYFVNLRGRDKVLVILVDGEPKETFPRELTHIRVEDKDAVAMSGGGAFASAESTESDPDGLFIEVEPLAVDIRGESKKSILKNLKQERFRFLSSMLEVDYDDLRNRQRERRIRRTAAALSMVFLVLAAVIGVISMKNIELNQAYRELDQSKDELEKSYDDLEASNQETLRGESYFLTEYADEALREGDRITAIKLALAALPKDLNNPERPYVPDAIRSLTDATGVYDYTAGYHVGFSRVRETDSDEAYTSFSKDGSTMLIEGVASSVGDTIKRDVEVYRVSDGEKLCGYQEADIDLDYYTLGYAVAALSEDGKKLYYLSKETGLTCVDTEDGKEVFTTDRMSDMRINLSAPSGRTAFVTADKKYDWIYGYDVSGKKTFSLKVSIKSDDCFYMGAIDPDSGRLPVVYGKGNDNGILVIDTYTGRKKLYKTKDTVGTPLAFVRKDLVAYLDEDPDDELDRIAVCDLKTGKHRIMFDPKWDITGETVFSDEGRVYTFHNNTIYELDVSGDRCKTIWKHRTSSEIVSLRAGDGLVALSCKDGSVYVYEEKGKKQIFTPSGDGKPVYLRSIRRNAFTTMVEYGSHVRVYIRQGEKDRKDVKHVSVAEISDGYPTDFFFANRSQSERFALLMRQGDKKWLAAFDSDSMKMLSKRDIGELEDGIVGIEELSFDFINREYLDVEIDDPGFDSNLSAASMKEVYRGNWEDAYIYYSEDGKYLFETIGRNARMIEAATGKVLSERKIPKDYYYAERIQGQWVLQAEDSIRIEGRDGKTKKTIKDGTIQCINDERGLLIYKDMQEEKTWHIYDLNRDQEVWTGNIGTNMSISFFGNNRYMLKDTEEIYDMDTWEKVLTLKATNGEVYGAGTTDSCPYFVVWCESLDDTEKRHEIAYLYEKGGNGDPVAVIENFVALTADDQIVAFDGEKTLYKFPLLTVEEILEKAKKMVGNPSLTEEQKKKYHLFR